MWSLLARLWFIPVVSGLLVACASSAPFGEGSLEQFEAALADHGLTVCQDDTAEPDLPGAVTVTTFVLALHCDTDDEAFVAVTEFRNRDDRDQAASQLDVRQMHGAGEAWTYGPFTVVLSGPRDDDVADAVAEALDDVGAR